MRTGGVLSILSTHLRASLPHVCNPSPGELERGGIYRACWSASSYKDKFWFKEESQEMRWKVIAEDIQGLYMTQHSKLTSPTTSTHVCAHAQRRGVCV